jgi:hypothetical protein
MFNTEMNYVGNLIDNGNLKTNEIPLNYDKNKSKWTNVPNPLNI